jgi:hypothetical protein
MNAITLEREAALAEQNLSAAEARARRAADSTQPSCAWRARETPERTATSSPGRSSAPSCALPPVSASSTFRVRPSRWSGSGRFNVQRASGGQGEVPRPGASGLRGEPAKRSRQRRRAPRDAVLACEQGELLPARALVQKRLVQKRLQARQLGWPASAL